MEPITVSITDAGRVIGVSRRRVYELIAQNEIESIRIGGRHLVKVASIHALVNRSGAHASAS